MKRWVVFLLLLALPARTVLAVAGFGCAMMPAQVPQTQTDSAPCAMHAAAGAAASETSAGDEPVEPPLTACPSCTAACCAALAPMLVSTSGISPIADDVSVVIGTSFADTVPHTLERPPRLS